MTFTYHYACEGVHQIGLVEADTHEIAYAYANEILCPDADYIEITPATNDEMMRPGIPVDFVPEWFTIDEEEEEHEYTTEEIWDILIDEGIALECELCLITAINGYNEEALNDVLFVRTGYRSINQMREEEG